MTVEHVSFGSGTFQVDPHPEDVWASKEEYVEESVGASVSLSCFSWFGEIMGEH